MLVTCQVPDEWLRLMEFKVLSLLNWTTESPLRRMATDDTRPPAMFIAGDPSLDFLNSIGTPVDTVVEWLADGQDLMAWLERAELVPLKRPQRYAPIVFQENSTLLLLKPARLGNGFAPSSSLTGAVR